MKKIFTLLVLFSAFLSIAQVDEPEMVDIPAGVFYMGGTDSTYELDWSPANEFDVDPRRWTYGLKKAAISRDFKMGKFEITIQDWADVMEYAIAEGWAEVSGSSFVSKLGKNHNLGTMSSHMFYSGSTEKITIPEADQDIAMARVTYYGAAFYCYVLNRINNLDQIYDPVEWTCDVYGKTGYRLPTEGEWVRATRGLNNPRNFMWDDVEQGAAFWPFFKANSNYISSGIRKPTHVGTYPGQGENNELFDMAGNVAEWIQGYKDPYYHRYENWHPMDPTNEESFAPSVKRITLGGSHDCPEHYYRYTYQWPHGLNSRDNRVGFRIVKTFSDNNKAAKPEFWPEEDAIDEGASVKFINVSMYNAESFVWSFSGGTPSNSTDREPTVQYSQSGKYSVTLKATNQYGEEEIVKSDVITVGEVSNYPTASFDMDNSVICAGDQVNYTNTSQGAPTQYEWVFVGGTPATSSDRDPVVSYSTPGRYNVSLKVVNDLGEHLFLKEEAVEVRTQKNIPFMEGFENDFLVNGWQIINPDKGLKWGADGSAGKSSASSLVMNNSSNSNKGEIDEIALPMLDLSNSSPYKFTFDVAYTKYNNTSPDVLSVHASIDCGENWVKLWEKTHTELQTKEVSENESNDWVPENNDWRKETVDISNYTSESNVIFKFRNVSGYGTKIWIDNLAIDFANSTKKRKPSLTSIYPNPSSGVFTLTDQNGSGDLIVYNVLGIKIFEKKYIGKSLLVNLSNQPAGAYFIVVKNTEGKHTMRWMKR